MRILTLASNFPDRYYNLTPWSKRQTDSVATYSDNELEVIAPRPFSLPMSWFPYHQFSSLPSQERSEAGYMVHYPRFPYLVPKRLFYPVKGDLYAPFVSRYIRSRVEPAELVHARFGYMDGYAALGVCGDWQVPLVFDNHGPSEFGRFWTHPLIGRKQHKVIDLASRVLCTARYQIRQGLDIGVPEEKLEYLPLGVDTEKFRPRDRRTVREVFGLSDEVVLLFVGQLIPRKGVHVLIEAVHRLDASQRERVRVIIIGTGPEYAELHRMADEYDLLQVISFLGSVSEKDLALWYSVADIFVLPSWSEARPQVILEAMASGCAIITTKIRGIDEQVPDEGHGLMTTPGDPGQLKEAIERMLSDEDAMRSMGIRNCQKVQSEGLTWKNYAERLVAIYHQVAE